jgi:hypothetical protein
MITSHCSFCSNVGDPEHGPQLVGVTSFTGPDAGALPGAGDVIKHRAWRDIAFFSHDGAAPKSGWLFCGP